MSRPAPRTLTAYDHLSGPPGSGKTAALAAQIDATLRTGVNPYLLAIITPSQAGADALRHRVQRLSGTQRVERFQFRPIEEWLRLSAKQPPAIRVINPTLLESLSTAAFAGAGLDAEFGTPAELLEEPVQSVHRPVADRLDAALARLDLRRPSAIGRDPAGRIPPLDCVFVDDIHLMRTHRPWLERCLASASRAVITSDPEFPSAIAPPPLQHFHTTTLRARERRSAPPSPLSLRAAGDAAQVTHFSSVDLEIQHILEALGGTAAPHTVVCASARVEARLLIRAAITDVPIRSPRPDSVYCSTELRLVSLSLRAAGGDHSAMAQLLLLRGVERSQWLGARIDGHYPTVAQAICQPEDGVRPAATVRILAELSQTLASWRRPDFNHALIERIAAWCVAHAKLERPWIFAVLASEAARVAVSVTELSAALEDALLHKPAADAPLLLRPEDLDGHSVPTLWLSLTHEHASDRADAFVYRAITRATSGVVVSRADIHAAAPKSSANTAP